MMRTPFLHTRLFKAGTSVVGSLAVLTVTIALANKPARPPKPIELAGVWIGFDNDELDFTRLDLRPDFTGYCARVAPSDTSLHEYGVHIYRVTHWTAEDWKFVIRLTPVDAKAESIYVKGRIGTFTLQLEVGATNGEWKRELVLRRESRIEASNRETREKIRKVEKK